MNLPAISVPKLVILTSIIAPTLTKANKYIPESLLVVFNMNLVMIAPRMAPIGKIPINIDWAADFAIFISYSRIIFAIGTDVISFILYPSAIALSVMINPIK